MRILVLSDVHYPFTDKEQLSRIIREERADRVIFLGDTVEVGSYVEEFLGAVRGAGSKDCTFLRGDEDTGILGERYLEVRMEGRMFIFKHGDQFKLGSEGATGRIATGLKKIHRLLPVLAYAAYAKLRSRTKSEYLVLGHSHALAFFPRLRVTCAGCLTTRENVYHDRGYVVIEGGEDGVTLSVMHLGIGRRKFSL